MTGEQIHDALQFLPDDMIEAADALRQRPKKRWSHWAALAACLCVLIGAAFLLPWSDAGDVPVLPAVDGAAAPDGTPANGAAVDGDADGFTETDWPEAADRPADSGIHIEPMEVNLDKNLAADMIAFFIWGGRSYAEYDRVDNAELVGEYLGTATGMIDEWTEEDGYVELAGSVGGDFYSVRGYDPAFMLCMIDDRDKVWLFINNNGLHLTCGADLYQERLGLFGNSFAAVEYETRESWYYGYDRIRELEDSQVIQRFWESLCAAEFRYADGLPLVETEIYHLYFRKDDGVTIHLRLSEGGYVRFQGLLSGCVQVDEATFNELIAVLEREE